MNAKRLVMAAICGVMTLSAVLCLVAGAEDSARADDEKTNRIQNLTLLYKAARIYALDHNGQWPAKLDDLTPYLPRQEPAYAPKSTIHDFSVLLDQPVQKVVRQHPALSRPGVTNLWRSSYCLHSITHPSSTSPPISQGAIFIEEIPVQTNEPTLAVFTDGHVANVEIKSPDILAGIAPAIQPSEPLRDPGHIVVFVSADLGFIVGKSVGQLPDLVTLLHRQGATAKTQIILVTSKHYPREEIQKVLDTLTPNNYCSIKVAEI